jgi:hypothetical protein
MTTRTFQVPETVPIWAEITDTDDAAVAPTSVVLTLIDPDETKLLDDVAMDATDDVGFYVYYWDSTDGVLGWYRCIVTATDGTGVGAKVTIQNGGFQLS